MAIRESADIRLQCYQLGHPPPYVYMYVRVYGYTVCCSVLQCVAVCCIVLQYVLQCVAECCSVLVFWAEILLQCCQLDNHRPIYMYVCVYVYAVSYGVLQCVAMCWIVYPAEIRLRCCQPTKHYTQHTATHCNTLQHTATHCNTQHYIHTCMCIRIRSVLQCVTVCCSVLQCVAVCCSVLQCVAVCCSVLQCVAVCWAKIRLRCCQLDLPRTYIYMNIYVYTYMQYLQRVDQKFASNTTSIFICICMYKHSYIQCVAVCCSVLQCVAMCCSVLQCVAVCCSECPWQFQREHNICSVLQCVAAWCSVLQRVAVCCSVLQFVAVCCHVLRCVVLCRSVMQWVVMSCIVL